MKISTFLCTSFFSLVGFSFNAQHFFNKKEDKQAITFKENKGQISDQFSQARPDILFSGTSGSLAFYLKNNGISYQLSRVDSWEKKKITHYKSADAFREVTVPAKSTVYRLDIHWLNCNTAPQVLKGEALSGTENYYSASCPGGALNVKSYSHLLYKNIYPGIDLKWYEKEGDLKYDYYVTANSDYRAIRFEYKGAEKISVGKNGELIIKTPLGILKEQKPFVTQNNKVLDAKWIVKNNTIAFDIKNADPSLPMIIDPLIRLWGTYYGGPGADGAWYTYADAAGNVYMSGETMSATNIATSGSHQNVFGAGGVNKHDAFVVKFNAAGVRQWATYYGGTGDDYGCEVVSDASGNVFLTGYTRSTNPGVIATPGAHQTAFTTTASTNTQDAYLVMFNSSGIRQWGTYYGGDMADYGYGVSVDNANHVYMAGGTYSGNNISTPGSHQPLPASSAEGFLVQFDYSCARQWATYFGGDSPLDEFVWDCANNSSGDVYICGVTSSTNNISTPGSHQPVFSGPAQGGDAFYAKFNSSGTLQWGTYYGGNANEYAFSVNLDAAGNMYGAGICNTASGSAMVTAGCHQSTPGGATDSYLVKFDPSGLRLWGTFYGGPGNDQAGSTCIDASGNIYVAGFTSTSNGTAIATPCAYQPQFAGGSTDAFLAKFTSTGRRIWGTYYGSQFTDYGDACTTDASGNVFLCGSNFANAASVLTTSNGHQPFFGGSEEAFLAKFDGCIPAPATDLTPASNLLVCSGKTTTLSTTCGHWYSSPTATTVLATGGTFTTGSLSSDTTFYVEDFGCGSISVRTPVTVTLVPTPTITITNSNPVACVGESVTLSASGLTTYTWTNNSVTTPSFQLYILLQTTYTVSGADANGCESSAMLTVIPNLCLGVNEENITTQVISYPNPSAGSITIRSTSDVKLVLNNELGQLLHTIRLSSAEGLETTISGLPDGIYFLSAERGDRIRNQKVIVLH